MTNITLFSQIVNKLNRVEFRKIVDKLGTDKHNKGITSWTHLISMLYLHFAHSNSLSEISNGLRLSAGYLNRLGVVGKVLKKSSLSYVNIHRDWHLFHEFFLVTLNAILSEIEFGRTKLKARIGKSKKISALDSTMVSLCLSLFDWAKYRRTKVQ